MPAERGGFVRVVFKQAMTAGNAVATDCNNVVGRPRPALATFLPVVQG